MCLDEQEQHEREESDPEYIINIRGRIANHAVMKTGCNLTKVGDQLCNLHAHSMKDLYDFALQLPIPHNEKLRVLIRKLEEMPANLISLQPKR